VNEQIRIPISTLKDAAKVLLAHIEELEGEVVAIEKDYYWTVPPKQLYDVFNEPSELTVGQVSECLERLDAIVADPGSATAYGLVWLADVARAVGLSVVR
jgi:hypothetical protein